MILDEQSIELAALGALDALDAGENSRLERERQLNPDLDECLRDFSDAGAEVALLAAGSEELEPPPVTVLTGALERVGAVPYQSGRRKRRTEPPMSGRFASVFQSPWALAACAAGLLILGGGMKVVIDGVGDKGDGGQYADGIYGDGSGSDSADGDRVVLLRNGTAVATIDADDKTVMALLERLEKYKRLSPTRPVQQNIERLKRELGALRKANAARFTANPHKARMDFIEMFEPGVDSEESQLPELTEFIVDAIRAGSGVDAAGGGGPIDDDGGGDTSPIDPDIILDDVVSGELPDLGGLGGQAIFWPEFPEGADHFERIDDGRAWDSTNQRIWIETDRPGIFQAVDPPVGFDPDFIGDYAGVIPIAGSLPGPSETQPDFQDEPEPDIELEAAPGPADDPAISSGLTPEEIAAEVAPKSSAITIYEETTGQGTVAISNLEPAPDGMNYQLWMRALGDGTEINIGPLPVETDAENFKFDLQGPGISPDGFFVTLEEELDPEIPSENIILQSP